MFFCILLKDKTYICYMRLGYCCINLTNEDLTTNRGMIKRTFETKGLSYVSELVIKNLEDLYKILVWNKCSGIGLYRLSSDIFPWMSEYELKDLPNYNKIVRLLNKCGKYSLNNDIRLTFHPGPFNVLSSKNNTVVNKTIKELNQHSEIMNLMGLPINHYYPINIHIGGAYGDRKITLDRFNDNFKLLNEDTKKRLVVENDDKNSLYSVEMLYDNVYKVSGIPITFDGHHHRCYESDSSYEDSLLLALTTWGDVTPLTHFSSSARDCEGKDVKPQAHADYIYEPIPAFGFDFDVEIEAKAKDLAVFRYIEEFC